MTDTPILENLNTLIREIFEDENITVDKDTIISDIHGWDSFKHITFLSAVESELGIILGLEYVINLKRIGELVDIIERDSL
jgi:acyl carrier protein